MRRFLLPLLAFLAAAVPAAGREHPLAAELRALTAGRDAEIGVAAIFNGTDTLTLHNDAPYPLLSVFKFHQALAVAHVAERRGETLDTRLRIAPADLLPDTWSPLRDTYPQGGVELTLGELLTYTLRLSDNNACDILFRHIGGVGVADSLLRTWGLRRFALACNEEEMHRHPDACYRNWSTPLEVVRLLEMFLRKPILSEANRTFIRETMLTCSTGRDRLPKPLEGTAARIGHKTGTSDRNTEGRAIAANDVGFVLLPDGSYYTLAVLVKDSAESDADNARIIADISAAVYRYATRRAE